MRPLTTTGSPRITASYPSRATSAAVSHNIPGTLFILSRVPVTSWNSPDDAWDESFAINFTAVRKTTQAFLPGMIERGWGRVICVTGTAEPRQVNAAVAAKAGVHAWAKGLSREMGPHGITVNCIGPGRVHSEQIDRKLHPTPESQAAFARDNIPLGYFGDAADVAWLIAFLCSARARYITGERIHVDGGMHHSV